MSTAERSAAGTGQLARRWLAQECAARLAQVLEAMTAETCRAEWLPDAAPDPGLTFWWKQPLSLGGGAAIWAGASQAAWSAIGGRALKAAGIDEADSADQKSTCQEILTQALSAVAQSVGGRLGREVTCQPGQETPPDAAAGAAHLVEADFGNGDTALVAFVFDQGLADALEASGHAEEEAGSAGPVAAVAASLPGDSSKTLDLLLEVELPVSISFGRAQLPLKDVLKLTTGSIVELNRSVSEPVEVIVNNCVIARGEVVVIEGNYGVRIHQIVSRQERLRNLN